MLIGLISAVACMNTLYVCECVCNNVYVCLLVAWSAVAAASLLCQQFVSDVATITPQQMPTIVVAVVGWLQVCKQIGVYYHIYINM